MTATAPAGLTQRALLEHLAAYRRAHTQTALLCPAPRRRRLHTPACHTHPPALHRLTSTHHCPRTPARSSKAPQGYTLGGFSWFIDQTLGGAVATATHGSSLLYGSLSSQARAAHAPPLRRPAPGAQQGDMPPSPHAHPRARPRHALPPCTPARSRSQLAALKWMDARGRVRTATPEGDRHLWDALTVSVGRLGIILETIFRIVPNKSIERIKKVMRLAGAHFSPLHLRAAVRGTAMCVCVPRARAGERLR